MLRRLFLMLTFIVFVVSISITAYALEFSADSLFTTEGQSMHGKIFANEDRFRMEMNQPQQVISIIRMDKNVIWTIMPSQKMYMTMPYDPEQAPKLKMKGEIDRKLLAKETINGHPTEKYLITYKTGNKTNKIHQWWATDINIPVRTADINNKWIQEYKNIKIGSQSNKLFEVPAGYSEMQIPKMPGGMQMPEGMNFR